ncbi:hypothetical protein PENANT_c090G02272 [Penicillium antarcticum]|uniref:Uncharacterized protein n=1 Tax=Penicillium antarcticum TaxID=416450 RepID=A0A1V6PM84_9EURO|nr:hypothetical protein PENANT_c090G02272 [Penicillium antarcticum]
MDAERLIERFGCLDHANILSSRDCYIDSNSLYILVDDLSLTMWDLISSPDIYPTEVELAAIMSQPAWINAQNALQLRLMHYTQTTSETHARKATSIPQRTKLGSNTVVQSWTSPIQAHSTKTAIDTLTLTWSDPRTTSGETTNVIAGYFKVDDELGSNGLVIQNPQSSRASLAFNVLVKVGIAETNSGSNLLQYTGTSAESDHVFTRSSESAVHVPSVQATSYQPPQVTPMNPSSSMTDFQRHSDKTSVGYYDEDSFSGTLDDVTRSTPKKTDYYAGNLGPSSHFVEYSRHFQSIQTPQPSTNFGDLDCSTPNLTTESQLVNSTNSVPATTTATKTTAEELTMNNSRTSRALTSHGLGLILGSISGAIQ